MNYYIMYIAPLVKWKRICRNVTLFS